MDNCHSATLSCVHSHHDGTSNESLTLDEEAPTPTSRRPKSASARSKKTAVEQDENTLI